jgi:hypothetical protein
LGRSTQNEKKKKKNKFLQSNEQPCVRQLQSLLHRDNIDNAHKYLPDSDFNRKFFFPPFFCKPEMSLKTLCGETTRDQATSSSATCTLHQTGTRCSEEEETDKEKKIFYTGHRRLSACWQSPHYRISWPQ